MKEKTKRDYTRENILRKKNNEKKNKTRITIEVNAEQKKEMFELLKLKNLTFTEWITKKINEFIEKNK